jgi:hypothetical protein
MRLQDSRLGEALHLQHHSTWHLALQEPSATFETHSPASVWNAGQVDCRAVETWCSVLHRAPLADWRNNQPTPENTGKSKVLPRTGHEGPEGEYRYSSTLSLTLALDEVGGQLHAPAALPPGNRPGTHCIGGWLGPRTGLDGCGKCRPHRD